MARRKIPVELCPTSNVKTLQLAALEEHPTAAEWISRQHPFNLNTDDSGVFNTTLSEEYHKFARAFNLSDEELAKLASNAVDYVFQSAEWKAAARRELVDECNAALRA